MTRDPELLAQQTTRNWRYSGYDDRAKAYAPSRYVKGILDDKCEDAGLLVREGQYPDYRYRAESPLYVTDIDIVTAWTADATVAIADYRSEFAKRRTVAP